MTPVVASKLEAAFFAVPDESVDVSKYEPLAYKDCVIRLEKFADVLPELHPLHVLHWGETERHRHGLKMRPDYEQMALRERRGRLVQVTARKAGVLVGHLRMLLCTSVHTQTEYGEEDTLFIAPEHRGGFLVMQMMRYAEGVLLDLGALEIRANSKLVNRADVLMRRLGYEPVAIQFVKVFKGNDDVA